MFSTTHNTTQAPVNFRLPVRSLCQSSHTLLRDHTTSKPGGMRSPRGSLHLLLLCAVVAAATTGAAAQAVQSLIIYNSTFASQDDIHPLRAYLKGTAEWNAAGEFIALTPATQSSTGTFTVPSPSGIAITDFVAEFR
jgi:hypothetical protein